ncbi:choice-of-anchor Q domain-containing protein [Chitinophaga sp. Hz27]|uniref:PKD domain-containing protein n=1 Tax=Chitinophaga sp. Hz27 TaxID=3347169 RepID=UPI0035DB7FDE
MDNLNSFNKRLKIVTGIWILTIVLCTGRLYGQQGALTPRVTGFNNPAGLLESLPQDYATSNTKYPLLIFCHGLDEEGNGTTDIMRVIANGPPKLISQGKWPATFTVNNNTFSFVVLCPQFHGIASVSDIDSIIDYAKAHYRLDTNKIYLTGLSRGGGETWGYATAQNYAANRLAAIVPIAGAYDPGTLRTPLPATAVIAASNNLPIWALHNSGDGTVPVSYSQNWQALINAYVPACDPQVKLTVFNANGHDAWSKAYDPAYRENGMNVYEWMLQYSKDKRRTVVTPPTTTPPVTTPTNKRVVLKTNYGSDPTFYYPDAMNQLGLVPGDTICIPAGDYMDMNLAWLKGTAEKPIVIINCGGLVRFGVGSKGNQWGSVVQIENSKFVEFTGTGDPGLEYGFDIKGSNLRNEPMFAMYWTYGSSDFDVHNVYIHDAGMFIVAKTTMDCGAPQYWEANYVMKNCKFHHIKGRTSSNEGFYIGNSWYIAKLPCGDSIRSHHVANLQVYDNDLQDMGNDGIQVGMAYDGNNIIHHNRVVNYGKNHDNPNSYGIIMNPGTRVDVYNNHIENGYGDALCFFGSGISRAYNNVAININAGGFLVADRPVFEPVSAWVYNNTFVNVLRGGTVYDCGGVPGHKIINNVIVQPQGAGADKPYPGFYIWNTDCTIKYEFSHNPFYTKADDVKFVNAAAQDYHLQSTSPLIDSGTNVSQTLNLGIDFDGVTRPQGNGIDIGAYEYHSTTTNQPPQVYAGADVILTLPANSTQLDGSATMDPDGTIASYAWSQVSGPNAATISSPATAKTVVSGLVKGVYVFKLTAKDNGGLSGAATVQVTVQDAAAGQRPPVAIIGADTTIVLPVNSIILDGTPSYDQDGTIATYAWTQTSGPSVTISSPASAKAGVANMPLGTYTFKLVVTDNDGLSGTATKKVSVIDTNDNNSTNNIISLYPNPTRAKVRLDLKNPTVRAIWVTIYTVSGVREFTYAYPLGGNFYIDLDVSSLPNGIHLIEVLGDTSFKWTGRLVKF